MIGHSNLVRHELIGLKCEACLKNNDMIITGKIIDETRNTLVMATETGKRTMIKDKYNFVFQLPGTRVKVDGTVLIGRPKERVKKKIEKW
ncbi:MAG: ribonuclease P protein subunit [Candidatus Aenigmarchaeota archaeon]|nr:ribonuclease P protein subunit [Candidatus Aenigmarchaeota archaeon]